MHHSPLPTCQPTRGGHVSPQTQQPRFISLMEPNVAFLATMTLHLQGRCANYSTKSPDLLANSQWFTSHEVADGNRTIIELYACKIHFPQLDNTRTFVFFFR